MAKGIRRKYDVWIAAPAGLNLLNEAEVDAYIRANIIEQIHNHMQNFVETEYQLPAVVRMPGDMYNHFKKALLKQMDRSYIDDADVKFNGVPVESICKYTGSVITMEVWNDDD